MAWRVKPSCSGSVTATICMIPDSRRRWTRASHGRLGEPDRLGDRAVGLAAVALEAPR